ncbi:MAG: ATP-binding protein [Deltaproteobacteria bacterium]|nr:ATP-binding protein [Deltaproteobacteria bacterium]
MALSFTACVPGELRFRDLVGTMVREVCRRVERDAGCEGLEWRVVSAYNEAFNNIVEHAYAAGHGEVEVLLRVDEATDRLVLRLVDHGAGFDFGTSGAVEAPPVDALSDGGMGLFIIRQSMTEVQYERREDRNHLTMTKRLSECAAPGRALHGDGRC